jgi:sialate O-acetylesterase
MRLFRFLSVLFLSAAFFSTRADVTLPHLFSTNMVLQRDIDIPVWGWASPGERVSITLNDQKVSVRTNREGFWTLKLKPMPAGGPYDMQVKGKNEIILKDILIGDVWVCSGQSNMEWPVSQVNHAEMEIANATYPEIRLFTVPNKISSRPLPDTDETEWQLCAPETIPPFTAVGYFFGRDLNQDLKVPIGLINTTWGGTIAESWTSRETISEDPDFRDRLEVLDNLNIPEVNEELEREFEEWEAKLREMDAGYKEGKYLWADPENNIISWKTMQLPAFWEDQGLQEMDGVVWFANDF